MAFLKPDPPTPPNPIATASAQTGTNVSTAVANAFLSNVNQVTPQGALNFAPTGSYSWTDPTSGNQYNIPTFTSTQTYSDVSPPTDSVPGSQQGILDQQNWAKYWLSALSNSQSGFLFNYLNDPSKFDPTGTAPTAPSAGGIITSPSPVTDFTYSGQPLQDLSSSGDPGSAGIQTSYGDSTPADERSRVEQSLFQRMQPQLDLERSQLEQKLADQGIRYGSPAYDAAMANYNQQLNNLRLGVISQGGQEQQLQEQIAANRAQFTNQAQQQAFQEALSRGQFANAGQQAGYQQAQGVANFYNNAVLQEQQRQEQIFNTQQTQRQQYLQEQYTARQEPLNEIISLMSGSQVTPPNWINVSGGKIPTTDVSGLINDRFQQELANYQQQNQNVNTTVGGIFGALAGYLKSDIRTKENIHRVGTVFTTENFGGDGEDAPLPIYQYSYKDDPASVHHIGPMAQDVEEIDPEAVREFGGTKYIDSSRVVGGILRAA